MEVVEVIELSLEIRPVVNDLLSKFPPHVSELTFTNLWVWRRSIPIFCAFLSNRTSLLFLTKNHKNQFIALGDVVGSTPVGDFLKSMPEIIAFACVSSITISQLRSVGISEAKIIRDADNDDYVYDVKSLASLKGNKFMKKRQYIQKILTEFPDAKLEPITTLIAETDCLRVLHEWCHKKECLDNVELMPEFSATCETLHSWSILSDKIFGFVLRLNNKVEAFAVLERLNNNIAVCHFEKANHEKVGASQLINKLVAEQLLTFGFNLVNREQDMGNEGLRTAKQGYYPISMVEKWKVLVGSTNDTFDSSFILSPFTRESLSIKCIEKH